MEFVIKSRKRKSRFSLLKKLTLSFFCFCSIVFILFNYLCNINQCYLTNRYIRSLQNRFQTQLFNSTRRLDIQSNDEQFARFAIDDQSNNVANSDQLIGSGRRSRLINLLEQPSESNARLKYLNLINHSSTNQSYLHLNQVSFDQIHSGDDKFKFRIDKDDVLIFLHIQKTGGTSLGKRLVHDLLLEKPCECFEGRKHCNCLRPSNERVNSGELNAVDQTNSQKSSKVRSKYWLFSRYSTGWICGLHADWTQLNFCADYGLNRVEKVKLKRRYFFITLLRDPVSRFLSEFNHVRKGATWRQSRYACSTEFATQDNKNENSNELMNSSINSRTDNPLTTWMNRSGIAINSMKSVNKCYSGENWRGVDLKDYMTCDTNLAINRMTRMLADLTKVGCLNDGNQTNYDRLLLDSAKFNLERLAYFGVLEYQLNRTHSTQIKIDPETVELIKKLNYLDVELYDYGRQLLFDRFERLKKEKNFEKFKISKISPLDNLKMNLNRFPELRLLQKLSKLDNASSET